MITKELLKIYNASVYRVFDPPVDIRIAESNPLLDDLLERNKCKEWAFITACNPYDQQLNHLLNFRRHEMLRGKLNHYRVFEAERVSVDESLPSEKSFLIIGINKSDAAKIGILFEQNAIVIGQQGEPALVLTLE